MRQRIPSIAERTEVAIKLGVIEPGETLTPQLQKKTAKLIQVAEAEQKADALVAAAEAAVSDPIPLIAQAHADLLKAGLTSFAADHIAAALAPEIWRANQGAAHALKR